MIYQMKALSELSQKIISEKFSDHFVQSYSWAKLRPSQINILAAREARPKAVRLSNGHPKLNSQSILIGIAYVSYRHRIRNPELVILY